VSVVVFRERFTEVMHPSTLEEQIDGEKETKPSTRLHRNGKGKPCTCGSESKSSKQTDPKSGWHRAHGAVTRFV